MADKIVIIDGITLKNGTGVKGSTETNTSTLSTFDGVIPQGTDKVGETLEIDRASYEGLTDYVTLHNKLRSMLKVPGVITVIEKKYIPNEKPFEIRRNYFDCLVDGKDYEIKPEEHTVENLKFICGRMEEDVKYL